MCKLNFQGVCRGCGRTMDEIMAWPTAGDERKRAIAAAARARVRTRDGKAKRS